MRTFIVGLACLMCGDGREIEVDNLAMVGPQPRCPRCNGAVLATDVTTRIHYDQTALSAKELQGNRMGRPPKWLVEQRRREMEGAA